MKTIFENFTNKYSVSKTLRFELIPQGKTKEHIRNKKFLEEDEALAKYYKEAKKIIDEYHKNFISNKLTEFAFTLEELQSYDQSYQTLKKDKKNRKLMNSFAAKQAELRKRVAKVLQEDNYLYAKEGEKAKFIKQKLPDWIEKNHISIDGILSSENVINEFKDRTNYFAGFNDNRKNIYTEKKHGTSIGFRLIHENLPKFLDNINRYNEAKKAGVDLADVEKTYKVKLDNIFTLEYFNQCLNQKGIDEYNLIRGGQSKKGNNKEKGINEIIYLHVQQLQRKLAHATDEDKKELNAKIKHVKSCILEELFKQILSDRSQLSFRLDNINNDSDLCRQIEYLFHLDNQDNLWGKQEIVDEETGETIESDFHISEAIEKVKGVIDDAKPAQLYIKNKSSKAITDISQHLFGNWSLITRSLIYYAGKNVFPEPEKKKETAKQKEEREKKCESWLKDTAYFSFEEIHTALELFFEQYTDKELQVEKKENNEEGERGITGEMKEVALGKPLFSYFKQLTISKNNEETNKFEKIELFKQIKESYPAAQKVFEEYRDVEKEILKSKKDEEVRNIKNYLEALMDLQNFFKPLYVRLSPKDEKKQTEIFEKDNSFYDEFDVLFNVLNRIVPLYNQTRNYLTKKPFSIEKYKLNFENAQLAKGWAKDKEPDYTCVLLMKNGQYYLAVMNKKHKKLFAGKIPNNGQCYKKIIYKQVPDASKDIHTLVDINGKVSRFTKGLDEKRNEYCPEIQKIKVKGSYTGDNLNKDELIKFIDYYKYCAVNYSNWKWCAFKFKHSAEYETFKNFTDDIRKQGYQITFCEVSENYINECVNEGRLYLFRIYSKDFSEKTRGNPNLHTMYWKALYDENNLKNVFYKLNGEAELFFRKASIVYDKNIWEKGHHANDPKKKQPYPIIKDRRYAKKEGKDEKDGTYLFHVPITCNFKAEEISKFNDEVNDSLRRNANVNILGIDRGERHLAYYTMIDDKGNILRDKNGNYLQGSLNDPTGRKDYRELLDKREDERDKARKTWNTIDRIKDLKEGYLSQVIHKIVSLMIEHNAIVILEDLNFGFKKGRMKVEKQVYQKLEKMLIDKLNYLVFKNKSNEEPGGLLKAFQLTAPFKSFKDLGKQTGFIFYVPSYYTSKICPATGFADLLYPYYETVKKSQEFFDKFHKIHFNQKNNYFEFEIKDYNAFNPKAEGTKQDWTICTFGTRLENYRNPEKNNNWDTQEVNLTEKMQKLFQNRDIHFNDGKCIKEKICQQSDSQFFKRLIKLLKLTLQIRNSRVNTDEDWMLSPVLNKHGNFFDSRVADEDMPQNADANGAYHIALKGLWCLEQIRKAEDPKKVNMAISNKEWLQFKQAKV